MSQITRTNFGLKKRTILTNAQIIALPTTPLTLLPALGASRFAVGIGAAVALDWTADYATIDANATMKVQYGAGGSFVLGYLSEALNGALSKLLAPADEDSIAFMPQYSEDEGGTSVGFADDDLDNFLNKALVLSVANGILGIFTGGDAANRLIVDLYYNVFDLLET